MSEKTFNETIKNASAINNTPKNKVFLFSMKFNSIMSIKNTLSYIKAVSNTNVHSYIFENKLYKVCAISSEEGINVDHDSGQLLSNLFALSFIRNITNS